VIVPFIAIYRLPNRVICSFFSARSVKHNACADYAFALSVDDKFGLGEDGVGRGDTKENSTPLRCAKNCRQKARRGAAAAQ